MATKTRLLSIFPQNLSATGKTTTDNVTEGTTNLYYTDARFDTRLATKSTSNLAEGTNLYYTDARVSSYLTANSYATESYVDSQITAITPPGGFAGTTYVNNAINSLVDSAPGALDTLNELAAALGDDANYATTVTNALASKLDLTGGTISSTSDQALSFEKTGWNYMAFSQGGTRKSYFGVSSGGTPIWGSDTGLMEISGVLHTTGTIKSNNGRLVLRDDSIENWANDNDTDGIAINYFGYSSGTTRFRNLNVYDGKGSLKLQVVGATGNVGVGIASPTARLEVVGTSGIAQLKIGNTTGGTNLGVIVTENSAAIINSSDGATGRGIQFQSAGSNTILINDTGQLHIGSTSGAQSNVKLYVNGGTEIGMSPAPFWNLRQIDYAGTGGLYSGSVKGGGTIFISADSYYYNSGYWHSKTTTSTAINLYGNEIAFQLNSGLTADTNFIPTTKVIIKSDGKVGIGNTNPTGQLHINVGTSAFSFNEWNSGASLWLDGIDGDFAGGDYYGIHAANDGNLYIGKGGSYTLTISAAGNVLVSGKTYLSNQTNVTNGISSWTDSGTKYHTHLATGSFYQTTGAIVITTNIPGHNISMNGNMFQFRLVGYSYSLRGPIDLTIGMYAGENNFYSKYHYGVGQNNWVGEIYVYTNTSGKLCIRIGNTGTQQTCELAVTDFVQGFSNTYESYAEGWSIQCLSSLQAESGLSTIPYLEYRLGGMNLAANGYYDYSATGMIGGLVLSTPCYAEYHYRWGGMSNHTTTLTCGSYQMSEIIMTCHQTNGGTDNNEYIRGKWSNNHDSHIWTEFEHSGNIDAMVTSFTVSQDTVSNSGRLVIQENYIGGGASYSYTNLIIRCYFGGFGISHS